MNILKLIFMAVMRIRLKSRSIDVSIKSSIRNTILEGHNSIAEGVRLRKCVVGRGTYIGMGSDFVEARIGRFTSISPRVILISGNHPTNTFVSTHPMFYSENNSTLKKCNLISLNKTIFEEKKYIDKQYLADIGNDVWIGSDVRIMNGISIGDGAVIAAGSVVVRDVEPYSIVGGVPARLIKNRFDYEDIKFLLDFKWWEKDIAWIQDKVELFSNIKKFKEIINK